jgi:exodeoxyribonuclease V alpha subunit
MAETLSGVVERVTFHNEDNGFCVLRVKVRGVRELQTVVGHVAGVSPGEYLDATGSWIVDREHGRQFKSDMLRVSPPGTLEGIEKYLGSGMIKGIGPEFARRLVKSFGERVLDVIEREPGRLLQVDGIGPQRQSRIVQAWADQRVIRDIMVFLQSHGIGTARAVRIYKTYGAGAVDLVRQNPYRLAHDIAGIGFRTADQLAMKLGVDPQSQMRAQAGLSQVLQTLAAEGHCAYPTVELKGRTTALLGTPNSVVESALTAEIGECRLVEEGPLTYLSALYQAETGLAESLLRLGDGEHPLRRVDLEPSIARIEREAGLTLSAGQKEAIRTAARSKVAVITGGPGVGKTTLIDALLKIFRSRGLTCALGAPTGRAAKRLSEATGLEAKTLHRLLEVDFKAGDFKRGPENPLDAHVVVLDEASMVDVPLMHRLARAVPASAALVIVGDVDQLPSVGPGNVLRDLIESGAFPVARLTEVFRQAARSRIVTNAHRINRGEMPELDPPRESLSDFYFVEAAGAEEAAAAILRVVRERIPKRFGLDPIRDVQVLAPMNKLALGSRALNAMLQEALNPPGPAQVVRFGATYRLGDKVMQTENDYSKEVFNGDLGIVSKVDEFEREVAVDYDGRTVAYDFGELDEIAPAYACSIHKSQGCEYPAVVIPVHPQHSMMLTRNVLYTGVTRGRKLVVLVGSKKALAIAVGRGGQSRRVSGLRGRLAR